MSCRGYFLGLTDADVSEFASLASDSYEMMEFANETLYIRCEPDWVTFVDKSWDAIHRCLTNGYMLPDPSNPMARCILGVQEIDTADNWIVGLCFPEDVKEIDLAIRHLDRDWLHKKYWALPKDEYGIFMSEDDFEYTWDYFRDTQDFFRRAAASGRHSLFIADQ